MKGKLKIPKMDGTDAWNKALSRVEPIRHLETLPSYAAQFFFKNMGPFRRPFLLLTAVQIFGTIFRFLVVLLLSELISSAASLTVHALLTWYLPLWLLITVLAETCGFFTRRYAEALPGIYGDWLTLRLQLGLLQLPFARLSNTAKERLESLVTRYVGHIRSFLVDWTWSTTMHATRLVIVLGILTFQSPLVLVGNIVALTILFRLAIKLSGQFSTIARRYSLQTLESDTVLRGFTLNLNTVRRLGLQDFFTEIARRTFAKNWLCLEEVRSFHARRWFIQLNIYNAIYGLTLITGLIQVAKGTLPLGFLVLIKWSFDQLWEIVVYAVEYFVSLVQQREDAKIIRGEFSRLNRTTTVNHSTNATLPPPTEWQTLEVRDTRITFHSEEEKKLVEIRIPHLRIARGEKIGIVGPSGAGKTSVLNTLLNLLDFEGSYTIDSQDVRGTVFPREWYSVVSGSDPLFKLSLRDNILLGREIDPQHFEQVLNGLKVSSFRPDLNLTVGDPRFNLSSGQEQRIRLARAAVADSAIYLLDEPFSGIDRATRMEITAFLREFWREKTVVLVTHHREELALVDRVFEIRNGLLDPVSCPTSAILAAHAHETPPGGERYPLP